MMNFLLYDAKVAVALLVFYLFYRFLLKKETFHRFNRVVLVGTAVLSFLLPLCIITIHKPMEMAAPLVTEPAVVAELPEQELAPLVQVSEPWWPVVLTILFWTGVACVLARVLVSILSILRIIRLAEPVREEDGCRILVTERNIDPFSWMKYIVLSRKDWELPHESILTHEKAHIAYGHSIEILLVDVLSALQWFNPAIWMLRADLKELHEYEADDVVLRAGANLREYQYLLIRKAVSKSGYSVANSFNHSILKNRITMMSKSKSPLARGLRVLWLLPLVCLAIGLQARTVYVPVDKDSEKNVSDETNSLSGTVWTGDVGKLTFSDTAFEIRMEEALVSGHYTSEGSTIRFIFTNYKSLKTGKEKKGEDQLTGTRKGDAITLPVPNGEMVFSRVNQRAVQKAESIVLNIRKDGTIESGGKVYTPAQLKDLIAPHQAGQPQTTVTERDGVALAAKPEDFRLARGSAFWVVRGTPRDGDAAQAAKPYFLYGQHLAGTYEQTLSGGSQENPASSLCANPTPNSVDLNALQFTGSVGNNDTIALNADGATSTVYVRNKANTGWGRYKKSFVNGYIKSVFVTDGTIPPGTGFWYVRRAEGDLKLTWPGWSEQ